MPNIPIKRSSHNPCTFLGLCRNTSTRPLAQLRQSWCPSHDSSRVESAMMSSAMSRDVLGWILRPHGMREARLLASIPLKQALTVRATRRASSQHVQLKGAQGLSTSSRGLLTFRMHSQGLERPTAAKVQHVEADQNSRRHSQYAASTSQGATPAQQESYNKRCAFSHLLSWHALRHVQDDAGL